VREQALAGPVSLILIEALTAPEKLARPEAMSMGLAPCGGRNLAAFQR